ncbi:Zn-dependent protease with chaperone function [Polaromonas sp. OV174]|uniref:M48 family metallopeptidase n=1 Tax=Polaromonas sp. OV174 TaxID=1855300 RepID=UPI0008F0AD73|nr:M48 family metallopeptidase [Polaromonas sp. OV174]SFB86728.1 Zn-dependent protease with chaperone function [Polaromonas sp. OV174]
MCFLCDAKHSAWPGRRAFLLAAAGATAAAVATPLQAQVNVGPASGLRNLVPADELEGAATQEYDKLLAEARAKGTLAAPSSPQLQRLRKIAQRLVPQTAQWNDRAKDWRWEVNLISSKELNAFCMPGGKIAFYTGILEQLKLSDDEAAMIMGHEMAHALREHARARIAKSQGTGTLLSLGAQLLGLGQLGDVAASIGTQLLTLRFSRDDETDADLVGLELAARAGYNPQAAVSLWEKMGQASAGAGGPSFLSTHPSGPDRIQQLQSNVPKVQGLYLRARG